MTYPNANAFFTSDHRDPTERTVESVADAKDDIRREVALLLEHRAALLSALRSELIMEIRRAREVQDERLLRIDQRFEERDTRTEQIAQLGRISLDAALAAAKEAVGEQNKSNALSITKSENSMKEQVNANATQTMTRIDGLGDKIDGLKDRVVAMEAGGHGRATERNEHRMSVGQITAAISAGLLSISIIASTLIAVFHH